MIMDELISAVSSKTGLGEDQARSAVDSVLGLLKSRLPAPLAGKLEELVGGATASGADTSGEEATRESGGLASEASALLGHLLGKKG